MLSDPKKAKKQDSLAAPPIDGLYLKNLVEASLTWLRVHQQIVNALNVFPVPDGDTGTNMVLTMQAANDEIANLAERNFGKMAHAVAHGALMGARGNSGVILSQLWRGFARGVDNVPVLDANLLARALVSARDTAYKGVVRPVEGTILTVAKDMAAAAEKSLQQTEDIYTILADVVKAADLSVQNTPELLPVLKDAGVVDSGGKGLFYLVEGMQRYIDGQPLEAIPEGIRPLSELKFDNALEAIEPGQDWEVVLDFRPHEPLDLPGFYDELQDMGTSIQVGEGDGIYRLHIHVPDEKQYAPVEYAKTLGVVTKIAFENLIAQMAEGSDSVCAESKLNISPIEPGQIAVVAVSPGIGISRIFASLGAAAIVEGGQTMNPSTQEIIHAFENLPTDQIIILPNNKNILLTATAAASLTVKKVAVIPSRSVPQGLAAMLRLIQEASFETVVSDMTSAIDGVETGEITIATRNVEIDDIEVQEGQYIGLLNGKLVVSTTNLQEACIRFLEKAHADHFEVITLFYGASLTKPEVNRIVDAIHQAFPEQVVEVQEGCQPHYHFIIAIE